VPVVTGAAIVGGAVGGVVMGSAAGAALERWPAGTTLRHPRRSLCTFCGTELPVRDLIPVLSWVLLRGRCRACSIPIDGRLPLLEVASGAGVALTLHVHGVDGRSVLLAVGVVAVLLAALIDLEHLIVPDRLTLRLAAVSVVGMGLVVTGAAPGGSLTLLVWAFGVPLLLQVVAWGTERVARVRPIGGGDIKLLVGVLALATAVQDGPLAVLVLAVLGASGVALVGLVMGRLDRRDRIPFAPAIAGGYLAVVLLPTVAPTVADLLRGAA